MSSKNRTIDVHIKNSNVHIKNSDVHIKNRDVHNKVGDFKYASEMFSL